MNILFVFLILFFGFLIPLGIKKKLSKTDIRMLNLLWLFQICTGISYYFFTRNNGGDAWAYWQQAKQMIQPDFIYIFFNQKGTEATVALNYIPANLMGMGFLSNTLLYSLLGFIAFVFLYRICIQAIPYNSKFYKFRLFPFLLFLPSLHFWSSGVGKDTILFLCIAMVTYGLMNIAKRFPLVMLGLLLSYGVRPHITLILTISFGFAYIINSKISAIQRVVLFIILIAIAVVIIPSVLDFVKMDELSFEELDKFSTNMALNLSYGRSFVDISSYPYPLKVLTFLYRPFFFDINGIPAVVASFENLLLLLLSIGVLRNRFVATFRAAPFIIQGFFIFFILGAFVFSMSMSNLGIILRQRNMFLPGLILFVLWSFSYKQELALKKKNKTC